MEGTAAWGIGRSGVLCDRKMPVKLKGEDVQDSSKASIGVWSRDMGSNENPTKETGCE